jgi:hypothetical protein
MTKIKEIPDELIDRFKYDEDSPSCLSYKQDVYSKDGKLHTKKDSFAGTKLKNKKGEYVKWQVHIAQIGAFSAHRVIWAIFYGKPDVSLVIDHIDGNSLNNKIENLRLVTTSINNRNSARREHLCDSTLPNGVFFEEKINGSKTKLNPYFIANWMEGQINIQKYFSVTKLGFIPAHYEAVKFRKSKEMYFTERHGK